MQTALIGLSPLVTVLVTATPAARQGRKASDLFEPYTEMAGLRKTTGNRDLNNLL